MRTVTRLTLFTLILVVMAGCHPKPVKTIENLKISYKIESTSSAKYAAFSDSAKAEGFDTIAVMFNAISKSGAILAANHLGVLKSFGEKVDEPVIDKFDILSTKENITGAIKYEANELDKMYTEFLKAAKKERCEEGIKSISQALEIGKKHLEFNQRALEALNNGSENSLPAGWFVCSVCGNTYDNTSVTAVCVFCKSTPDKFLVFN